MSKNVERTGKVHTKKAKAAIFLCTLLLSTQVDSAAQAAAPITSPRTAIVSSTTVIHSIRSGSMKIEITRDVEVSKKVRTKDPDGPNDGFLIEGAGRTVALAIISTDFSGTPREGRFLLGGRFTSCRSKDCSQPTYLNHLITAGTVIEKGSYVLHVVTDRPVEVTLRLKGAPRGESILRPAPSDAADMIAPQGETTSAPGVTRYAAGETATAGQTGFSLSALHLKGKDVTPYAYGICQYDLATPPWDAAYGPQCAALSQALGSGAEFVWNPLLTENEVVVMLYNFYNGSGDPDSANERGLGAWAEVGGTLDQSSFSGFFLDTEDGLN